MRIKKPKFWDNKQKTLISILLLPISALYLLFFWINRIFVNSKTYKKPTIPVICVGNILTGRHYGGLIRVHRVYPGTKRPQ